MTLFFLNIAGLLILFISHTGAQRVAPGVPPQQYQHAPHQQQHHQQPPPPQQYQHVPAQQQQQAQVNYHQEQVPVQPQHGYQQPPQAHQHPHGGHEHPQQVLNTVNIQQDRQHIAEHMEVPIDTSKMSEQELQFHYFKMHDSDNNNKLDGCELVKSLIHWHEQGSKDENRRGDQQIAPKIFSDEELISLIDPILQMDDTSRDGYIDYPEFIKAQQKAAGQQQQNTQQQGN